jgi:hypothetical protein
LFYGLEDFSRFLGGDYRRLVSAECFLLDGDLTSTWKNLIFRTAFI